MVKQISPTEMLLSTLEAYKDMAIGNNYWRDGALTTEIGDIIIDTIMTVFDTGLPETGIKRKGSDWIIVEQYETLEQAIKGHDKWIESVKSNPNQKFIDINILEGIDVNE